MRTVVRRPRRRNVRAAALKRGMGADMVHGPSWYRAMSGLQSQPPRRPFNRFGLGSLGDDPVPPTSLSVSTLDTTQIWQSQVLSQLQSGVDTLKRAELQKWLQIAATLSIPLAAAIWKMIFRRGAGNMSSVTG